MHRKPFTVAILCLGISLIILTASRADSTISPANPFSYGANVGWVNNKHDQPSAPGGLVVSEFTVSGYAYGANIGWIFFGASSPANGVRYTNVAADTGVNHDGSGNFSGYAYSANAGWISFGWAGTGSPDRPRISLATGAFSGYAYGANIGWLNLATLTTASIAAPDTDGDGIADAWETEHFGNLTTADATSDHDGDGASDRAEYQAMTDPADGQSYFRIVSQTINAGMTNATIVFTSHSSRRYRLQWTPDLTTWLTDTSLGIFSADPGPTTTRTINFPTGAKRFFRAVSVLPLQN